MGAVEVWNPFGQAPIEGVQGRDVAFTPNAFIEVQGLLLLKIVTAKETEFAWLCLTDFNEAFFRGETETGTSSGSGRAFDRRGNPSKLEDVPGRPQPAGRRTWPPVAVAPAEVVVHCGDEFTIDGTKSSDPEGRPLEYRFDVRGGALGQREWMVPVLRATAPKEPQDVTILLHVIDGGLAGDGAGHDRALAHSRQFDTLFR